MVFPDYPSGLVFEKKKIGNEIRMARELVSGEELVFAGKITGRARILFGIAHEAPNDASQAELHINITGKNGLRAYTISLPDANRWIDETLDLSLYTDERILISFSAPRAFGKNEGKLFITCPHLTRSRASTQHNVILISIDTLRADHLGCYGYQRETTPFLDRFSKNAILFENCISPASWTLPAHVSLFTGLYSSSHAVIDDGFGALPSMLPSSIPEDLKTLPEILTKNGYNTRAVVTHLYVSDQFGFDRGFSSFLYKQDYKAEEVTRQALQWVNALSDQPFFLFLHYFDCHDPYTPPPPFTSMFDPDYSGYINGDLQWLEKFGTSAEISTRDLEHLIALYDGEIRYVDAALETLIQSISDKNLMDNTIIIITSDHGEEFKEHGSLRHGATLFDEVIKVPLLVYIPTEKGPRRITEQVSLVDVMPSILEALHISLDHRVEGVSFFCADTKGGPNRAVFSETSRYDAFKACVRTREYKYIADSGFPGSQDRLFDLILDPREQKNILTEQNEKMAKKAGEMKNILLNSLPLRQVDQMCLRYQPVSDAAHRQSIAATVASSGHFTYADALGGWPSGTIRLDEGKSSIMIFYKNLISAKKIGINFIVEPLNATVVFSDIEINGAPGDIIAYTSAGPQTMTDQKYSYEHLMEKLVTDSQAASVQRCGFYLFKTTALIPAATLSGKYSWETKQLSDENRKKLRSLGYVY